MWGQHVDYNIRSQDQKGHDKPHFNHVDLRNAIVPLTTLLASYDANTDANGVNGQKSHVATHYNHC